MAYPSSYRVTICTSCRHKGRVCAPGYALIERLCAAIEAAGDAVGPDFEIAGTASIASCDRPCTVAYRASRQALYFFGDIDPEDDIEDLVDFARHSAAQGRDWGRSEPRPSASQPIALARIPAAIIAVQESWEPVS